MKLMDPFVRVAVGSVGFGRASKHFKTHFDFPHCLVCEMGTVCLAPEWSPT